MSIRPARIAGFDAPTLREGALAELVLVDPEQVWTPLRGSLRSKSENTPFLGKELRGRVLCTLAGGRIVFDATGDGR
jgi:dihydroorotase